MTEKKVYTPHGPQVDKELLNAMSPQQRVDTLVTMMKFLGEWHIFYAMKSVNATCLRDLDVMVKWQHEQARAALAKESYLATRQEDKKKPEEEPEQKKPRHEEEIMSMEPPK